MSVRTFSTEQLEALKANPYVSQATSRRITYTDEFKSLFVRRYKEGFTPRRIFHDAGFDVDALGYKRIERASDRWRQLSEEGKLPEYVNNINSYDEKSDDILLMERTREAQAHLIMSLLDENKRLKRQIAALESLA